MGDERHTTLAGAIIMVATLSVNRTKLPYRQTVLPHLRVELDEPFTPVMVGESCTRPERGTAAWNKFDNNMRVELSKVERRSILCKETLAEPTNKRWRAYHRHVCPLHGSTHLPKVRRALLPKYVLEIADALVFVLSRPRKLEGGGHENEYEIQS